MRCQISDIAKCNLHISRMHEWISFFRCANSWSSRLILHPRAFLSCYFHFNSILLFFFIPLKIFHFAITWVQMCVLVWVCVSYENLCQIIVNRDVLYLDLDLYCISIVFCVCWKNQRIRLNHGAVAWIHAETLTTKEKNSKCKH